MFSKFSLLTEEIQPQMNKKIMGATGGIISQEIDLWWSSNTPF